MKKIIIVAIVLIAAVWLVASRNSYNPETTSANPAATAVEYTCSMHPQIRQPGPGQCPICGMDLIPVTGAKTETGPRSLTLSSAARALARVETAPVARGRATRELHLAGTLRYQNALAREITLFAEAQIRKVHVPNAGARVKAGDVLVEIYSPDVFSAARELVAAGPNESLARAARQKLHLLGVADQDIEAYGASSTIPETVALRSPFDGVTTGIEHHPGEWLMKGQEITRLLDDSVLWAELDLYERDSPFVEAGLPVTVTTRAFPERKFEGTIVSVSAEFNEMTRVTKVIASIPNTDRQLKPGMFADAVINAKIPGEHLLVPASAVLMTGRRAVVYIQSPADESVFESRVITTGARAGDQYVVADGLAEGERVVTRGAMKLDSTMQLMAKPSMMSVANGGATPAPHPQTNCPVEGGEIDRDVFVDYGGYRIYFCCPGCDKDFLADPEQFIARMKAGGVELEKTPAGPDAETPHHHEAVQP